MNWNKTRFSPLLAIIITTGTVAMAFFPAPASANGEPPSTHSTALAIASNTVVAAYADILQRAPDPEGLALYTQHLIEGRDAVWLRDVLWNSQEAQNARRQAREQRRQTRAFIFKFYLLPGLLCLALFCANKLKSSIAKKVKAHIQPQPWQTYAGYFAMLILGMVFLAIRNPDPLINPVIYTEDGVWAGGALTSGWRAALVMAKPGYPVWGNLILLNAATKASSIISGNPLLYLPETIALFSYLFFACFAVIAFAATAHIISRTSRFLLFALILLIPLGDSSNEIIGRLSNIGFFCLPMSTLLFFWRINNAGSRLKSALQELAILFCASSNPVVVPTITALLAWRMIKTKSIARTIRDHILLFIGITIIVASAAHINATYTDQHPYLVRNQHLGAFNHDNLVEATIARNIIYPFVFPYYKNLNDRSSVLIMLALCGILAMGYKQANHDWKILFHLTLLPMILFSFTTLLGRPWLSDMLNGYQHTFPDRYFMAQNVMMVTITLMAVDVLARSRKIPVKCIGTLGLLWIMYLYITSFSWIMNSYKNFQIKTGPSFREQISITAAATPDLEDTLIALPIYFYAWFMKVDNAILQDAAQKISRGHPVIMPPPRLRAQAIALKKTEPVLLVPDTPLYAKLFPVGVQGRLYNGEKKKILRHEKNDDFLYVYFSGKPLDGINLFFWPHWQLPNEATELLHTNNAGIFDAIKPAKKP